MKRLLLVLALVAPAHADWVTDAQTSAQVTAPLGTPADVSYGKDGNGKPRCNVHLPNGAIAPFRCKLVATAPTNSPASPSSSSTATIPPAPASSGLAAFYTDIVNGPADAFLTIYGTGFGAGGTVTVGGVASTVVLWTDTLISVRPNGSGAIVINGQPTTLIYSVVPGKVTLVSTAAGIQACIDAAAPGDHCVIRGGTYSPVHPQYGSFFSIHHRGGTAAAAIVVMGYPGEVVTFARTTQERGFHFYASLGHIVVANLVLDAKGSGTSIGNSGEDCPTDIRIVGNEVKNFWETGGGDAAISGSGTDYHWLGNYVHDNGGSKLYHALYFDARCANAGNSELAYNRIERQTGGRGIQIFGDSSRPRITNINVHHNFIRDVGLNCLLFGDRTGDGMVARYNVISRCANHAFRGKTSDEGFSGSCIRTNDTTTVATIDHNTLVDCDVDGDAESGALTFDRAAAVTVRDNIIVSKRYAVGAPPATRNITGNVWFGGGAPPSFDTAPLGVDPRLDGNLKATNSDARGKGAY